MVNAADGTSVARLPVILVADDEQGVCDALAATLRGAGYYVHMSGNGAEAFAATLALRPDLVLLDLRLPVLDGYTVLRQLRAAGCHVPVIVISGYADLVQRRIEAYQAGAQDVVAKPWDSDELLAIVHAQLARERAQGRGRIPGTLRVADLELDLVTGRARRAGRIIDLLPIETRVLTRLLLTPGVIVPFATLAAEVWPDIVADRTTYEPRISHLRRKIDTADERPLIHTVKGVGYVIGPIARAADRGMEPSSAVADPTEPDPIEPWFHRGDQGSLITWPDPSNKRR